MVYIGRCDASGSVDDSMVSFCRCNVEVEDVAGCRAEMTEATICDYLMLWIQER